MILEFAVVLFLSNMKITRTTDNVPTRSVLVRNSNRCFLKIPPKNTKPSFLEARCMPIKEGYEPNKFQKRVDNVAMLVFGIAFILFNVHYWFYYVL